MASAPSHQSGVVSGLIGVLPLATVATPGMFAASNSPNPPTESSFESDWLPNSIMIVKLAKEGAEAIPFSFVRGVFGMVLTLLETVQKVKENQDDLKEVCASALEIVQHVDKMITLHGDAIAGTFKDLCTKFMSFLEKLQQSVEQLNKQQSGMTGYFKRVLKADSTAAKILTYREQIKQLQANFMMVALIDNSAALMKVHEKLSMLALADSNIQGGVSNQEVEPLRECPPPSPMFHGRRNVLDQMHAYFTQNIGHRHVSVLYGLGGAGKTQTGLKFVEESSRLGRFSTVFFIDTSTLGTLKLSFQGLAVAMHAGDTTEHALQWLITQRTEWLLLFNNADNTGIDLQQFMPRCSHGSILITTRNPALCVHAPDSHYRLSDMEEADAVELLLRSSLTEYSPEKKQIAREIVQAGAYISKTSVGLERYLDLYMQHRARLLKEKPAQTQDGYAFTVYTTWEISFKCLSKPAVQLLQLCSFLHHEGINETIFSRAIHYKGIELGELGPTTEDLRDAREFLAQFVAPSGTWIHLTFEEVMAEIQGYSLIELDTQRKIYSIHPLVHTWTQSVLPDALGTWHCVVTIIQMSGPFGFRDRSNQRFHVQCLPHIDSLLTEVKRTELNYQMTFGLIYYLGGSPAKAQQLLSTYTLGRSKEAAELQAMVLEKRKLLLGEEHPDTLIAMANLAASYRELGRSKEAAELEAVLQAVVLDKSKLLLGEEHPDTLSAMGNLAASYWELGRSKEAAELEAVVLEKRSSSLGKNIRHAECHGKPCCVIQDTGPIQGGSRAPSHGFGEEESPPWRRTSCTLSAMGNLAASYRELGRSKEAAELRAMGTGPIKEAAELQAMGTGPIQGGSRAQSVVLEKRKLLLGEEHPDTLIAMGNLATSYRALGRSKEAAELKSWALGRSKEAAELEAVGTGPIQGGSRARSHGFGEEKLLLGDEHPDTLSAMGNLAASYWELGRSQEAAELEAMVLEKRKLLFGEEHPDTLSAMGNLATSYRALGRSKEAAELRAMVLEKRKLLLGEEHPDTLSAMGNLAASYWELGQSKEAAELEAMVLEKRKLLFGEENPHMLTTMGNLAA
ncbi:hypothetical protein B0H13DRAFT_2293374 [Mycena leptocephala]|nr:hypothetical protein B0H13DRAFT_2293374 [Mycena leptocephala]